MRERCWNHRPTGERLGGLRPGNSEQIDAGDAVGRMLYAGEKDRSSRELLRQMTSAPIYNVLFLCTGNSARSILAESLLNHLGAGRFRAFSAGSYPKGKVHPLALELLKQRGLPAEGLRSKSWDEFAATGAPALHFIFTVCDNAAGEICPIWPGKPTTARWGIADPATAAGTEEQKRHAFRTALGELEARIQRFVSLPIAALDPATLKDELRAIGQMRPSP